MYIYIFFLSVSFQLFWITNHRDIRTEMDYIYIGAFNCRRNYTYISTATKHAKQQLAE
jgi:hypothetical protein